MLFIKIYLMSFIVYIHCPSNVGLPASVSQLWSESKTIK